MVPQYESAPIRSSPVPSDAFSEVHIQNKPPVPHGTPVPLPLRCKPYRSRHTFQGGPPPGSFVSALGGRTLRTIGAAAAISLLALASFGTVLTFEIPTAPDDALAHAEEVSGDAGNIYVWKCPAPDGSRYITEKLELDVIPNCDGDILRVPTVFVPVPVLLVDPGDPSVKQVAEHILSVTEGYSDDMRIAAALSFVQSVIRYTSDEELYGCTEFWASPSETLHFRRGDCEDTSVLLMSILGAMGYDSVLLDYDGHEAVGALRGDCNSSDYLFCETAYDTVMSPGWGEIPGPTVCRAGDVSLLNESVNGLIASYRAFIGRVAGT